MVTAQNTAEFETSQKTGGHEQNIFIFDFFSHKSLTMYLV